MEVEAEIGSVPIPVRTGVNRRETFFKQGKAQASIVFRTELSQSAFSEVIVSHLYDKGWTQIDEWRFCRATSTQTLGWIGLREMALLTGRCRFHTAIGLSSE
jgi:hypothetical protein